MEAVNQLQKLGFSQYEAQAYVALLRENPLNGYELARASGVPRANIYTVLQRLEEEGAVMRVMVPEGTRYAPVAAEELLERLNQRYQQSLDTASTCLKQIPAPPTFSPVLNFQGYVGLIEQACALVSQANQQILMCLWPEEAKALSGALSEAQARGVQVTVLCLRGCPQTCPACQGVVYRYAIAPESGGRWLVLATDDQNLLAGEIFASGETSAVRTHQPMLVSLTTSYIQNSIALALILSRIGDQLAEIDVQRLESLHCLRPLNGQNT